MPQRTQITTIKVRKHVPYISVYCLNFIHIQFACAEISDGEISNCSSFEENPNDVLHQAFKEAFDLFEGKVNGDPRETDNAWGATLVKHIHDKGGVFSKLSLLSTKESKGSKWMLYDPDQPGKYFADHGKYIQMGYQRKYAEYL